MKKSGFRSRRALLLISAAVLSYPTALWAQSDGTRLEEIVVTAQKREQNLQQVPVSISALSSNMIQANRIQDVRDLTAVAPNLTVRPSAGGSQLPAYSIRGTLTGGAAPGTDKGVALYIDGVYLQNAQGSIFELADIERIEVLKGPQGTLFGRNATGGAVSIITKNPSGSFGVKQEVTFGNYDQFRSKTRIDLPQWGPISAAVTFLHSERRGDIQNSGAGTTWDYTPATNGRFGVRTSPKWLGSNDVNAVQGAVRFDLMENLDLIYKVDYSENHYTPEAQGVSYIPATSFLTFPYLTSPNPKTPITTQRPDAVNNAFTTDGLTRSWGHNLTAAYRINDDLSVKNILAFRKSYTATTFQLDGLGGLINTSISPSAVIPPASLPGGDAGPIGAPFSFIANNGENDEWQWSDEFQVNWKSKWVDVTAGYIHFHDDVKSAGFEGVRNTSILTAFAGQRTPLAGQFFVIPSNPGYQHSSVVTDSDALYFQPEFHVTERLDLVGGVRVTWDRKRGTEFYPVQPANLTLPRLTAPINYTDTEVSWLLGVNYRVTDTIMTYAKYSTGYISGGQLATISFQPEKAFSYELGAKADLFDRRWRSNLALFNVHYDAIQYTTSGTLTGVPSALAFSTAVVSSADGNAVGFEWENTVIPFEGLTLTANVGYTRLKFDKESVFPGFVAVSGLPGYQVFNRPDWTGNLAGEYRTPEVFHGGHVTARMDAAFQSEALMTSNISTGGSPTAPLDPRLQAVNTLPFQWNVNGRLALDDIQVNGAKMYVALWARNIFDNKLLAQSVSLGPVNSVIYQRARTFGVDIGFQF